MAGVDILRKGIVKKLGNGSGTDMFSDPWIHRPGSFRFYSPETPQVDRLVRDYVIDGSWDVNKLNLVLWPVDVVDITRMVPPQINSGATDIWSWYFEDSVCYSVKSGYKVAMKEVDSQGNTARASELHRFKWMQGILKLNV